MPGRCVVRRIDREIGRRGLREDAMLVQRTPHSFWDFTESRKLRGNMTLNALGPEQHDDRLPRFNDLSRVRSELVLEL
jgi:hypothetical protein